MKVLFITFSSVIVLLFGCSSNQQKSETVTANEENTLSIEGPDSAKSVDAIKKSVLFGDEWNIYNIDGLQILVGLSDLPTSGESYIDVHGYVYNRSFKEWRRFCLVKTRNVGWAEIQVDREQGVLYLLAKANNDLKGKRVFQLDLGVLSDDRAYVDESIKAKER